MRYAFVLAIPLALAGAPTARSEAPATIDVKLANFNFSPRTIILDQGRPYRLRLANVSGSGHDFTAPAFFAAATVTPSDRRWIQGGEVEVPPGQLREIRLTAPRAGSYKLRCTHRFHKFLGMSGLIIVR